MPEGIGYPEEDIAAEGVSEQENLAAGEAEEAGDDSPEAILQKALDEGAGDAKSVIKALADAGFELAPTGGETAVAVSIEAAELGGDEDEGPSMMDMRRSAARNALGKVASV